MNSYSIVGDSWFMNKSKIDSSEKNITERKMVSMMKEEYQKYLSKIIETINITDESGKILVDKDLKVIHKPSGFEYTVDDVIKKDGVGIKIILRSPESPRNSIAKNSSPSDENKLEVDQEEFEKNYRES